MKPILKALNLVVCLTLINCLCVLGQTLPQTFKWKVNAQSVVTANGSVISSAGFAEKNWIPAIVPGTVFYSYVKAGKERDPDYADNIYKADHKKYNQPFWYRAEFGPINLQRDQNLWLKFNGINKRAEVYFNGRHLGTISGLMQRGIYNITNLLHKNKANAIAILVVPPRFDPEHHHELANWESPTYICSASWDWMPAVPGLNSGITDSVSLNITRAVSIADPWVRADLPNNKRAGITISANLTNSSSATVTGRLRAVINPGNIVVNSNPVILKPDAGTEVTFSAKEFPQLQIKNPALWWPNGYGAQPLYTCKLSFESDGTVNDEVTRQFGIRKISCDTTTLHGPMRLYVNGVPILVKGGNWGMSDYMLKVRGKDYDTRIRLHKAMNFNMIRNWTGEVTDDAFYQYCDKYGIMVWDDFWLNNMGGIDSVNLFKANVIEKIKKFRNHPSIVIWCGANEGLPGGDAHGPISNAITSAINNYDGDYRIYLPRSNAGVTNPNFSIHGGSKNLSGSGIWANTNPKTYFTDPHNGYLFSKDSWGMRSELGMATFINPESFKKFMPAEYWVAPTVEVVNSKDNMWARHFFSTDGALGGGADPVRYIKDINRNYGAATSLNDFCKKAQMFNLETMKAMFEAWNDHMWNDATGMLIWMSQSAYPSMIWQTYDYYYDLTGAYFGAKYACEPVHIQWNPATYMVKVINNQSTPLNDLIVEASVYNTDGKIVPGYTRKAKVNAKPTATANAFVILNDSAHLSNLSPVHFLKLKLYNSNGKLLSENMYWMGNTYLDYTRLGSLPAVGKDLFISKAKILSTDADGNQSIVYNITNKSLKTAAFGLRVQLLDNKGKQILPALISDSYFSLMQGEQKTVNITVARSLLKNGYHLDVKAYNN